MKKLNGFTLIEVMIVIAIIGILIAMVVPVMNSKESKEVTWGLNGLTESRCIDGYKFIVGQDGGARQIMDEAGRGIRCHKM